MMEPTLLDIEQFRQVVGRHTGLVIPDADGETISRTISQRMRKLGLPSARLYFQFLEEPSAANDAEWRELAYLLTTGESYFFRDTGQFDILKKEVLPRLIEKRFRDKTLRLWSAGCSSGEEPYSLAILLNELLPTWQDWEVLILGTDINERALMKAREGIYGPWSFRRVEEEIRERHFTKLSSGEWALSPTIRKQVRFQRSNLVAEPFPVAGSDLWEMDLIICRNVFIYFEPETVQRVLAKFVDTLLPHGYLITGHAELGHGRPQGVVPEFFPQSVVYHKVGVTAQEKPRPGTPSPRKATVESKRGAPAANPETPRPPPKAITERKTRSLPAPLTDKACQENLHLARKLLREGLYDRAIAQVREISPSCGSYNDALLIKARALANMGRHDEAGSCCQEILTLNPVAPAPLYLLAQLAHERGEDEVAKDHLKKVLYLDPRFIAAYLELGAIFQLQGEVERAQKLHKTALGLLAALPDGVEVEIYEGWNLAELKAHVGRLAEA